MCSICRKYEREIHTKFLPKNMKERDLLVNLDVQGRIKLKWILNAKSRRECTGFIWLRTGNTDELL
jgi:hypothetical protein